MSLGWEVGGWVASAVIGKLVDKVASYIGNKFECDAKTEHKLKCLKEDLIEIKAVLHEAGQRRIENPYLEGWILRLKDATYDAEDVFDMFEYKILQGKVEGKADQRLPKRLCMGLKSLVFSDDDLNELEEVAEKFSKIVADKEDLIKLIQLQPTVGHKVSELMQLRVTTSMPVESELFGRDKERKKLMKLILPEPGGVDDASSSKNVHVLPIVGMGGVGKTTIAQDIYNDQNVKNHFNLKAWVCVSDHFDVKRLVKEIIESAKIEKPQDFHNLQSLDSIVGVLKEGLTGKRFLIVLDDVWNEVKRNGDNLHRVLNTGKEGSRVIVTTRSQNIAKMMGTKEAICLEGLADQEFLKFFILCAFGDENPADYPGLEQIGEQIAKRLGGNPLAAKTIGGVLKDGFDDEHWREVLNSELWKADQTEDGIMPLLRLSYEYLPSHLKQCFVYCCLFPKDYRYSKKKLVRLWMAQGFLLNNQEKHGETYIDELVSRSFLQKHDNKRSFLHKRGNKYVIHDLLHDLAQNLSNGEILIVDNRKVKIPERVRHISIHASNLLLLCNNKSVKKNLKSLVISNCNGESLEMLKELKGLRMLLICYRYKGELSSESIHTMFHLRYLEFEDFLLRGFHKLPKSLGKLYHLQVLYVEKWQVKYPSVVLPKETNKLINLHHLGAHTAEIVGIGALILLQKLSFHVKQRENGFEIGQLGEMSQLRKLNIEGLESVESKEQASEAMLENKEHLGHLKLKWKRDNNNNDSEVLEGLRPPQNLKHICIVGYAGRRSPSWWNGNWLSCLQSIILCGCPKWEEILLPLGQLCCLKKVDLLRMNAVRWIVTSASASSSSSTGRAVLFPSLVLLNVMEMPELEELSQAEEEGLQLFPRLSYFSYSACPKLKGSRLLFPPSQYKDVTIKFDIENHDAVRFECETDEKINILFSRWFKILMVDEWIPWNNLTSTEHLCIEGYRLPSISREWFQHLNSLRTLTLNCCHNIMTLPAVGLRPRSICVSLQRLHIQSCSYNLSKRCRKDGPDWHTISHIPYIKINDEVVQNLRNDDDDDE